MSKRKYKSTITFEDLPLDTLNVIFEFVLYCPGCCPTKTRKNCQLPYDYEKTYKFLFLVSKKFSNYVIPALKHLHCIIDDSLWRFFINASIIIRLERLFPPLNVHISSVKKTSLFVKNRELNPRFNRVEILELTNLNWEFGHSFFDRCKEIKFLKIRTAVYNHSFILNPQLGDFDRLKIEHLQITCDFWHNSILFPKKMVQ
jgi:hypothetical protein